MSTFFSGNQASRCWLILLAFLAMTGCATLEEGNEAAVDQPVAASEISTQPEPEAEENPDPWEGFNRAMYSFNDGLDDYVLKPVAEGYQFILPDLVRTGIANFFSNLEEPIIMVNDLLQGKFLQAAADSGRFLVNTTIGLAGLLDVAKHMNLEKHDEDFGQTLGVWGVEPGPFVIWPFLGAMNLRDTVGWTGDWVVDPITYIQPPAAGWGTWGLGVVDRRSQLLGAKDILKEASSGDPYIFLREAYKQQRINKIYDGNPPVVEDAEFDALLFSDDDVKK